MDGSALTTLTGSNKLYRCPGETCDIDRAVHLARLAAYYPACRQCEHRHDTGPLSPREIKRLGELDGRVPSALLVCEGLAGVVHNELLPGDVRRFAAAFGSCLLNEERTTDRAPQVILAGDGRALTAELVAAAGEGLRMSGCAVIDIGAATSGLLAWAVRERRAAGGLLIGNEPGEPHTASVKLWGAGARPWSLGGSAEPLRSMLLSPLARPTRHAGPIERFQAEEGYLQSLRPLYHGLRPLRIVLDTRSLALVKQLESLLATSACHVIRPQPPGQGEPQTGVRAAATFLERRLVMLSRQVRRDQADFGLWIDGDGEICHLVDETGRLIAPTRLLATLLVPLGTSSAAIAVVEQGVDLETIRQAIPQPVTLIESRATREAMFLAMQASGAAIGGGASGRYWFNHGAPQADALLTLSLVLSLLSQTDRELSVVSCQ